MSVRHSKRGPVSRLSPIRHTIAAGIDPVTVRGDDGGMAAAVGVVIVFILLFRFTVKGKGAPAARLASLLAVIMVLWLFVAVRNPAAGADVARWGASGTSTAVGGIGAFIGDLFSGS